MFGTLKSFGDKLADGVREFENNLAQPLVQQPRQPSPRPSRPSISTASPQDGRDSSDLVRPDSPASISSPKAKPSMSPLGASSSNQSASQLADSAMSSLRASLRKGRSSLEPSRTQSNESLRASSEDLPGSLKRAPTPVKDTPLPVPTLVDTSLPVGVPPPAPAKDDLAHPKDELSSAEVPTRELKGPPLEDFPIAPAEDPHPLIRIEDSPSTSPPPSMSNNSPLGVLEPSPVVENSTSEATPTETPSIPIVSTLLESSNAILPEPLFSIATADPTPNTSRAVTPHPPPPPEEQLLPHSSEAKPEEEESTPEDPITDTIIPPPLPSDSPAETSLVTEPKSTSQEEPVPVLASTSPSLKQVTDPIPEPPIEPLVTPALAELQASSSTSKNAGPSDMPVRPTHSRMPSRSATPEITQAYKRLQTLKSSLDQVVADVLGLSGVSDVEAFQGELQNLKGKASMSMAEVGRLSTQLTVQKDRMEEIRDTHRLEAKSQSEQIELLQSQLKAAQAEAVAASAEATKGLEDFDKLKIVAKEEEEKRVKALSLLRALRQKLTKAEKEKEDVEKERDSMKSSDATAQDMIKADRQKFDQEIISLRATQEQQLTKLRQSFDRETNSIRAQAEREAAARKSQFELDIITAKSLHSKELATKEARVRQLEETVRELSAGRDSIFDQLQLRTAEMESSTAHQESLQGQTGELQYELKEARDRIAALQDELEEAKKARRDVSRDDATARRLMTEAETRHESKVRDLEARARQLEKDRQETEEEMGRNLQDRLKEVERMRQQIAQKDVDYAESVHSAQQRDAKIEEGEKQKRELRAKVDTLEEMMADLREEVQKAVQTEAAVREELNDRMQRASELEGRLEEVQAKESSLRSNNKTLREELRKLQSGILLSEKQRNPGVGYFASYSQSPSITSVPRSPTMSDGSETPRSRAGSIAPTPAGLENGGAPGAGSSTSGNGDAALNFEYLRNVILQFLERPEMRPHLIGVLGVILHFTPAESRRLTAKAGKA